MQHGIAIEDIYNSIRLALVDIARVVTRADYYGKASPIQPGNREWVTVLLLNASTLLVGHFLHANSSKGRSI
jgi:hypothetical protein